MRSMLSLSPSSLRAISEHRKLISLIRNPLHTSHLLEFLGRVFRFDAHQDNFLATILVGRLRRPEHSLRLLGLLHHPNIFPFNAAIRVFSDSSPFTALSLFIYLKRLSLSPNDFTFSDLFKASSHSKNVLHVFQLHAHVKKSFYSSDPFVSNALLSAYSRFSGHLSSAHQLFDEMSEYRMGRSWTSLIAGYARFSKGEETLSLFLEMVNIGFIPEDETMVSVLSACSSLVGRQIDKWVKMLQEYGDNYSVCIVLLYLYGKLGRVDESRKLFDNLRERIGRIGVVAWNAMISGHVQNGEPIKSLDLFFCMLGDCSTKPNHVTFVSVLSACAMVGDLNLGRWAHEYLKCRVSKEILKSNKILGTALIDMYSKCGNLVEAKKVFDRMTEKDVVSFNAMIMGLAMNGEEVTALNLFSSMRKFNVKPNDGTFLGLLCACAHSGMVEEGRLIFNDILQKYSIDPKLEHYACFTDLLARAGHIEEALEVVENMPIEPNGLVWGSLLGDASPTPSWMLLKMLLLGFLLQTPQIRLGMSCFLMLMLLAEVGKELKS
ncbi:hypothetical protein HPP92_019321 [Vanilla planifolia]|uniref:Pentatricopeptide repeat-containing protein n=1 Tax=Vanilla planifolia TaxID=51239 RepID=A0A835UIT7_VANPL|nr:hypothetical protein HPP92_019321 [Vanilla planifolia]